MQDELVELFEMARYKEIASQAFYIAGQGRTEDPGAKALMRELAQEELEHARWLEALKERGLEDEDWYREKVPDLLISEYLTGGDTLEGASVPDTLLFAMKREQQSIDFYSKMMDVMKDETARRLCERLRHEEMKHKLRVETIYDDLLSDMED